MAHNLIETCDIRPWRILKGEKPLATAGEKRKVCSFLRSNHFQFWLLAACLASSLIVAGCATRKPAPPRPTFPATSEASIMELHAFPRGSYDQLAIITVTAEIGGQLSSAIRNARDSAAQKGANALVVLQDTEFPQRVGKHRLWVRRITYLAIHRGDHQTRTE